MFPVSVKGVAVQGGKVLLLLNERDEWELPGGKLEVGEDSSDCVVREIGEESGWQVTAGPLLDCWQYEVRAGVYVVIVTYGCHVLSTGPPVVSQSSLPFAQVIAARSPEQARRKPRLINVVDSGFAVDLGYPSPPEQPRNPDQPPKSSTPTRHRAPAPILVVFVVMM